jgi:hypothetical protein
MLKKITILTLFVLLVASFGGGLFLKQKTKVGKVDYTNKMVAAKDDGILLNKPTNGNGDVRYSPPPPGAIPGLVNYMDYATNGNSLQEIYVFPGSDTIAVAVAYCDSLDAPNANAGTTLRSRYNYTVNSGTSWELTTGVDFSSTQKSRYPDIFPTFNSGSRTLTTGGRLFFEPLSNASRGGGISSDLTLGVGVATLYILPWTGVTGNSDAFAHLRADGKVGVVVSPNSTDSMCYTTWDPATATFTARKHVYAPNPTLGNTVSSYTIGASASGGHMTIAYCYINEPGNGGDNYRSVRVQNSTDNGTTWSAPVKWAFSSASPNVLGGDSCQTYWHEDLAYKPGTTTPYLVFSTYPYVWANGTTQIAIEENKGWKIMIQSPAINGGTEPVTVADWHNIEILNNVALYNQIFDFQVNSALLSHPSIGFSSDGSTIWVAYSVIQPDTCTGYASVFNYFDVYVQKSTDGGLTWSTPQNVSNTPTEDEMYPVVAENNNNNNYPYLVYQWNAIPGCHAFTDLQTVGVVYEVFKSTIIGVKNISNEIPAAFSLKQNFPNPFNPATKIRFDIARTSNITLKVYNVSGQEVATILNNENVTPGTKEVEFNGANLASGVYFYTLAAGDFRETKKMILVK